LENNKKELINWAIDEFSNNLEIYEQKWNYFSSQPYYDYKILINIDDKYFEGRGVDTSQDKALSASVGEALERYALDNNNLKSSNGCAFHITLEESKLKAQKELLERHYVMLFTLGYWDQKMIKTNLPTQVLKIIKELQKIKIEINFYELFSDQNNIVVLCEGNGLASQEKFGLIYGASCDKSIERCIEKSFKEALVNIMAALSKKIVSITIDEFNDIPYPTPIDHLHLYINTSFAQDYLSKRHIISSTPPAPCDSLYRFTELPHKYDYFFSVVKATHPQCIDAKWGKLGPVCNLKNHNINYPFLLP